MDFKEFVQSVILDMVNPAMWLMMSLAIVYFLWNIAEVIRKSGQPDELAKFKSKAVWGIVAIFVMTSVWGLVNILVNTFKPGGSEVMQNLPVFHTGASSNFEVGNSAGF